MDFILGGLASVCAGVFTNPLDVLKTRMQLQGELQKRGQYKIHYRNIIDAARIIVENDGFMALQKGLVAGTFTQFLLNGTRFGMVDIAKTRGYTTDKEGHLIFYKNATVSSIGGIAGAILSNPFFLIKTQIQSRAALAIAVGHQHEHLGTWSALKTIISKRGIKGLFMGLEATMARAAIGSPAQLTSFFFTKEWLAKHKILVDSPMMLAALASIVGSISLCLAMAPLDLISVRLYNQAVDDKGKGLTYDGILDCIVKIWRTEGFLGFYKGLIPSYIRLGPHTVLCLVFWEKLKDLCNKK